MKKLNLEEEVKAAEALIERDPKAAAWMLADRLMRLVAAETTLYTIRTLSQNMSLASQGDLGAVNFAFQRDVTKPVE